MDKHVQNIRRVTKLADDFMRRGQNDDALRVLLNCSDLRKDAHLLGISAKLLFEKGDFEAALSNLNRALRIRPDHRYAWYQRAVIYHRLGKLDEALSDYRTALKYERARPEILMGKIAEILMEKDELPDALDMAQRLLDHDPKNEFAKMLMGKILEKLDKDTETTRAMAKKLFGYAPHVTTSDAPSP